MQADVWENVYLTLCVELSGSFADRFGQNSLCRLPKHHENILTESMDECIKNRKNSWIINTLGHNLRPEMIKSSLVIQMSTGHNVPNKWTDVKWLYNFAMRNYYDVIIQFAYRLQQKKDESRFIQRTKKSKIEQKELWLGKVGGCL